jgi:hypothetical protein
MLVGCAPRMNTVEPASLVEHFQVRVVGDFGPVQLDGDPETDLTPASNVSLTLRLHWEPSRHFRDGSFGRLVEFDEAEMSVRREGKTTIVPLELAGRAVELRTFPNGEVLDVSWISRISGAGRSMDVFDVVFSAISPSPPPLKEKQSLKRRIMLPYRDANRLRWDHSVNAVWTHSGQEHLGDTPVTRIEYRGPWQTEGMTRGDPPRTKYNAIGTAEGVVLYDQKYSEMVHHQFDWKRQVQVIGTQGTLTQDQTFSGTVERLP